MMTATLIQSPDRIILPHISWQTYQSLIKDFEQEPALRLTYDHGMLEIRMPLDPHETYEKLLGRLVEAATEELDIEIRSLGSRTCDRADLALEIDITSSSIDCPSISLPDSSPNSEMLSPVPDNRSFLLVVKIQQFLESVDLQKIDLFGR